MPMKIEEVLKDVLKLNNWFTAHLTSSYVSSSESVRKEVAEWLSVMRKKQGLCVDVMRQALTTKEDK